MYIGIGHEKYKVRKTSAGFCRNPNLPVPSGHFKGIYSLAGILIPYYAIVAYFWASKISLTTPYS
jgi:hypothetical protein